MSTLIPSRRALPQAEDSVLNLSFYKFIRLSDLQAKRNAFLAKCQSLDLRGSILIAAEGINGFVAGPEEKVRAFIAFLNDQKEFTDIRPKESWSSHVPFTRMLVKVKKEIITMGVPDIDPAHFTGKRVYPKELKSWLDEKRDVVLLDTRNDYEINDGTFKAAVDYDISTFRQFPEKLKADADRLKDKTVVMFCTGGIRCEKATALALQYGLKDVYQLEGGILKYFEETGGAHWKGDCFVFDGRGAVDGNLTGAQDRKLKKKIGTIALHGNKRCPFTMRVKLTLEEKHLPYTMMEEDLKKPSAELLAMSPDGEVPVLKHNDLYFQGSAVITEYLDELFENPALMPKKPDRRARVRAWTAWCDSEFAPAVSKWVYRFDQLTDEEKVELDDLLIRSLYKIQAGAQRRDFLVSSELTLADLHVFPMIKVLGRAKKQLPDLARFEKLWAWVERVRERSAFKKFEAEF